MNLKYEVLKILELRRGEYVSGEEISHELGVSRNAVWKAVKALQAENFGISGVKNKGYSLSADSDKLTKQGIEKYLTDGFFEIVLKESVPSTNSLAKEYAHKGVKEGTVVVANGQTEGRGRMGRKFFSPKDCGVYFSVILRPKKMEEPVFLTVIAGLAVAEAISEVGKKDAKIKWVNDVFVDGRKCCGILSEAVADMESGNIEYVVVGIGINVRLPKNGFDEEIKEIAGVACGAETKDARNRIVAEVLNKIEKYYLNFDKTEIFQKYRERSFIIGQRVLVVKNDTERVAKAIDIDGDCRLCVEYDDKHTEKLSAGEVRIKW